MANHPVERQAPRLFFVFVFKVKFHASNVNRSLCEPRAGGLGRSACQKQYVIHAHLAITAHEQVIKQAMSPRLHNSETVLKIRVGCVDCET